MVIAYVELLARLRQQLERSGIELAVCTYPSSLTLNSSLAMRDAILERTLLLPAYSAIGFCEIADVFADATRAFCDSTGSILIDFDKAIPRDEAHFADSVHLTGAGARRAAEAAQAALRERIVSRSLERID